MPEDVKAGPLPVAAGQTRCGGGLGSVTALAGLVDGASAGVLLNVDGEVEVLPGLADHDLLTATSPVLDVARSEVAAGYVHRTFLWPLGGPHAPDGYLRVTVLASPADAPTWVCGLVLLSPPGDLRRLTPRELEVLGLVVDGRSNWQISRTLVVAERTVAAHVEHILDKLDAPTRTAAAVRADRTGLYVPDQRALAEPAGRRRVARGEAG
jgi:DNA-binding CsgD family transcriptional regulator